MAPVLPLVDDIAQNLTYRIENDDFKDKDNVIHLTVIQNPSEETFEKLKAITSKEEATTFEPEIYQDEKSKRLNLTKNQFFEEHNKRVQKFNQNVIKRQNSKF